MTSYGTEFFGHGHSGDYSQTMLSHQVGNQDYPITSGAFNSPPFFSMDSQTSSNGFLSATPPFLSMEGQYPWDDLEVATSVSMEYSETAASASMESWDYEPGMILDKYITSPISTDFPTLPLVESLSSKNQIKEEHSASSPESQDSEDTLEDLLSNLKPTDGKYRCVDVQADDHTCDYIAERRCMLRKHLESTLRTNICRHPICNGAQFSSKAVLTRHEKETHGMHEANVFKCPVTSCERHTRTFPREYNMLDHIQRVHKDIELAPFVKKNKRSKKYHSSSSRQQVSPTTTSRKVAAPTRSSRPQKTEKKFRECQERVKELAGRVSQMAPSSDLADVRLLQTELENLTQLSLTIRQNGGFSND